MNKKGKNKKGKVPNPSPLQGEKCGEKVEDLGKTADKKEEVGKIGDVTQNLEEKVESVKEERVPEIVSEIIISPDETKDEEGPKKPKRNRGKKKKGKDDDFDDNLEENVKEFDIQSPVEETKVDIPEAKTKPEVFPVVTPTARKKKNKKKNIEQKAEERILPDQDISKIPTETEIKESKIKDPIPEIKQECLKTEITEQEIKPSKKKNKKNKRNDSEKSDKEEFSCTAAFQNILDDKDKPLESKVAEKTEDSIIPLQTTNTEVDKEEIKLDQLKESTHIQPKIEKATTPIRDQEETKEIPIAESKSKKKNKKDKKHTQTLEQITKQDETKTVETPILIDFETPTKNIIAEQVKEEVSPIAQEEKNKEFVKIQSIKPIGKEPSPKPTAKIAKPVEKIRKDKQDALTLETSIPESSTVEKEPIPVKLEILETDKTTVEKTEPEKLTEIASESKTTQLGITSDIAFAAPDEDEKLIAQEFELLAEKAMGKKRKKGSKVPKTFDISSEVQEQKLDTDIKQTDTEEEINKEQLAVITEILTPQAEQQEFIIISQKSDIPISVDTVQEINEATLPIEQSESQCKILLTPENIPEEKEFTKIEESTTQQTEDKQKTENKSCKKRKKSPKPPKKTEAERETGEEIKRPLTPTPVEIVIETSQTEEPKQESLAEKIDATNITRMYDIEISSIKADASEESACDVVPDVTYPRASSQQFRDDNNNNTVIREIFPLEETTPDTGLSQEYTQTPTKLGDIGVFPKEEKTDIKSKMMEVNQDMEELRLSIERSLAELTSMEKSEEAFEKEVEVTRMKAKNISSLLFVTPESATSMTSAKEKETEKQIPKADIKEIKPTPEFKMTTATGDNNKQKIDVKSKAVTKEKTPVGDRSKTSTQEKNKDSLFVERKMAVVPFVDDSKTIKTPQTEDKPIVVSHADVTLGENKALIEKKKVIESFTPLPPIPLPFREEKKTEIKETEKADTEIKPTKQIIETQTDEPPVCPARKDNKGKQKKKKGKQDIQPQQASTQQSISITTQSQTTQEIKKEEKTESKSESQSDSKGKSQGTEKCKQQASDVDALSQEDTTFSTDYEPIENFEDALTSSVDDVNKTFEMIVKESQKQNNPKINIIAPDEEKSPVSPPKNLLGHPDIPVRSNRRDFKKEKDKIPNEITAKVKIKDSVEIEKKQSKNTQTINKMKEFSKDYKMDDNEDFVYKYSFRKVFLQSSCHLCKKDLKGSRVPCSYCNLLFYCSNKHKDEDWPHHQALCFAVSTIGHLKDQKHIYADATNLTGHDYRLIRMQMIVSCEKVLKRRLVPWEQEALLYPRICAHLPCREWRQSKLSDCQGCGQISFCTDHPDHFPKSHSRWCKSYSLYEKLVCYQQIKGRLEPKMPTKVLQEQQQIPEKINEVLASVYEEKIDINDIQYAALTQLATAPLTAAYCYQLCNEKAAATGNGVNKKSTFTIHVVGAELQFEADALNKWEVFFLHLRPDLQELRVVLINYNLNPSNLPLELLGKIKLCENCRQSKRRVVFSFQDKRTYSDYKSSEDFVFPDIVCAFNPSIQRSSVYNGKDPWPSTINKILKFKIPFIITAYTITEIHKDCIRIKECSEAGYNFIAEPQYNNFASVRPDRNFISDEEMPLLFKNYCYAVLSG